MAHSRLPFLYPNLLRSVRSCEPTTYWSFRYPPQRTPSAAFHSSYRCEREGSYHRRYGPAAESGFRPSHKSDGKEPASKPSGDPKDPKDTPEQSEGRDDVKADSTSGGSSQPNKQDGPGPDSKAPSSSSPPPPDSADESLFQRIPDNDSEIPESSALVEVGNSLKQNRNSSANGVGSMYHTTNSGSSWAQDDFAPSTEKQNPRSQSDNNQKPPHLSPSPYVHHFDTYTLVKDLSKSGFTEEQSVSMMKAVRGLLADNLEMARAGLISKSDFENETYLFQAACSELQNSLQTSRNAEIQNQRTRRAQLQHELDIVTQRMTQDLTGMKDGIKEMFNDQKISTRELQRSIDTSIQELNYQITVSLNSDGKSEAEGLRWILTRRAALAIATSAGELLPSIGSSINRLQSNNFLYSRSYYTRFTTPLVWQ